MNRLYAPSAIPLLSSERVGIQGKVGNISVMTVAISRIDNVEYIKNKSISHIMLFQGVAKNHARL